MTRSDLGSGQYAFGGASNGATLTSVTEVAVAAADGSVSRALLCTWSTWYLSLSFLLNVALQCAQEKGRASEWITMCFIKVFLMRNVWLHSGHLWGFSPATTQRENQRVGELGRHLYIAKHTHTCTHTCITNVFTFTSTIC